MSEWIIFLGGFYLFIAVMEAISAYNSVQEEKYTVERLKIKSMTKNNAPIDINKELTLLCLARCDELPAVLSISKESLEDIKKLQEKYECSQDELLSILVQLGLNKVTQ